MINILEDGHANYVDSITAHYTYMSKPHVLWHKYMQLRAKQVVFKNEQTGDSACFSPTHRT